MAEARGQFEVDFAVAVVQVTVQAENAGEDGFDDGGAAYPAALPSEVSSQSVVYCQRGRQQRADV